MILCYLFEMRILNFLSTLILIAVSSSKHGMVCAHGNCISDEESLLLINLKNSLTFDPSDSIKLSKWNPSTNSWDGVTCEEGHVTGLDLSGESISGGLNDSSPLFSFKYLRSLNLALNLFNYTEIPNRIGNLSKLENLNVSNAEFAGQVPIAISELTKLTTLDLSVQYVPPDETVVLQLENPNLKMLVSNLGELRELYLDGANVSATGTEWCGALSSSLPKLQVLSMSNCYLSGPIDRSLMNLRNLSVIRLSGNYLSTTVPDFIADFTNLTSLQLGAMGLYGMFPERIFTVPSLQNLDLSNNYLLNGSLPEFPRGGSLQTMDLSFTGFYGVLPNSIGYLRNLSKVKLVNCNFGGQIPSSMANLTQLAYLDFSINNFTGPIMSFSFSKSWTAIVLSHNGLTGQINSTQWEYLENLQILDLGHNLLEGGIPSSLFTLPIIQSIQLSDNRFSGGFKLNGSLNFSSYQLEKIDLSSNNLTCELPKEFFEFPQLKYISLSFNNFSGSMDIKAIQRVRSLAYLDLSYNSLFINVYGSASDMEFFPPLYTVGLAFCHLRKFPYFLKNQPNLIRLDLSNNEIEGMIPEWLWNLTDILYLNLSSNLLDGTEKKCMESASELVHARSPRQQSPGTNSTTFTVCILCGLLKQQFEFKYSKKHWPEPDYVDLLLSIKHKLYGSIPDSICGVKYLQVLDLSSNNLTGKIPSGLTMDSLKVLNLRNNSLTGGIPDNFTVNCSLKTLDLWRNRLEGKLPHSLKRCTSLDVLNVGSNLIEDAYPCHLMNATTLRVLVLRSNRFSGQIGCPSVDNSWSSLQIVDLANNLFTALPPESSLSTWKAMQVKVDFDRIRYQYLGFSGIYYQDSVTVTMKGLELELVKIITVFTTIDFSSNRINGSIPAALGNFTALRLLNLSHNVLFGPIPVSLGNMHALESLDLSKNQLHGTIPPQLVNLNFLSVLNLSSNEFVGRIPVGKQFNTFTEDSYRGNAGLCGVPLQRVCDSIDKSPVQKPDVGLNNDDETAFGWEFFTAMGIGFVGAVATVVACLAPWRINRRQPDLVDKFVLLLRLWFNMY